MKPFNSLADTSPPSPAAAAPKTAPVQNPGLKQVDGNQSALGLKPTRGSLQDRSASPATPGRSGMETAMSTLADQLHTPKFRGRR